MKQKTILILAGAIAAVILLTLGGIWLYSRSANYTFYKTVPPAEAEARTKMVRTAEKWLGTSEGSAEHRAIIDLYNSHQPLAQNYRVQYDDEWCATFVSAVAIECGFTDIIPTECGCQRQIGLFRELGVWEEADDHKPLPGDIIYYSWGESSLSGDCTGWSDHVGIVVGTNGNFIKVIEGNKDNKVAYRYLSIDERTIRGYAIPGYGASRE